MKSPLKRRVAIAALLLAPLMTACGFSAQTDQVYQAAVGVNDRAGVVELLNAQIVSAADGTGTFIATLDNNANKADRLISVTGSGVTATTKGIDIPADGVANLALPAASGNPVQVQVDGTGVQAGKWVRLTFTFASGQSSEVLIPIVTSDSTDYKDVPLPSAASSSSPAAE
ncbi:MAG: hypothetical protein ACJ72O_12115 [Marmoricola sp.]